MKKVGGTIRMGTGLVFRVDGVHRENGTVDVGIWLGDKSGEPFYRLTTGSLEKAEEAVFGLGRAFMMAEKVRVEG